MSDQTENGLQATKISRRKMLASMGMAGAAMVLGSRLLPPIPTASAHAVADSVFNVKSYGAVGNGVTDDTAAIQSAVNAAAAVRGVAFFPAGRYKVTQININNFVKLEGVDAGTTGANLESSSNAPILYVTQGCTIENLAIHGNNNPANTLQDGIYINNVNDVYVRNVFIKDTYNNVHIKDSVFYAFFDNVRFYSAVNCLVYGEGTVPQGYAVQFNNCQATIASATYGFFFDNCGSVIIDSLMMSPTNATTHSIVFNTLAELAGIQQISNTVIEGSHPAGLYLKGTAARPIRFVFLSNTYIAGDPSVLIDYGRDIFFDNCYFTGSAAPASNQHAIKPIYQGDNLVLANCEFAVVNVPLTAGTSCTSLSYDVVNPMYTGGYQFLYAPFLGSAAVNHISVLGGKIGSHANPIDLSFPNPNVMVQVIGFHKLQYGNIHVASGTATKTYYIPHGLVGAPKCFNVQAGSQDAGAAEIHCVERDATNLIVSLKNFPPVGTNNLIFVWSANV